MKKIPILQIVLVLVLIGVVVFGFSLSKKKTPIRETGTTQVKTEHFDTQASLYEAEQKQVQEKMTNATAYNTAVSALDIAGCDDIVNNDVLKNECIDNVYSAKASKEKDASLCTKIQDTKTKARCTDSFAYDAALASGKQSDCEKIASDSDLKSACMKNIVFARIENTTFSGSTDVCATLTGADKEYCINRIKKDSDIDLLQKGTTNKDINVCAQIQDVSMKNTCTDAVYLTLAMEKNDSSLCARIMDAARKTKCTAQFAKIADATSLQTAIAGSNLSLCAKITTPELKTKCSDVILMKQALLSKDANVCANIVDASTKKQCNDAIRLILEQMNKQK